MSTITEIQRGLFAMIQPITGERASATALVTSLVGTAVVPRSSYLIATVDDATRHDLIFKVDVNPATLGDWEATTELVGGTEITLMSNVGGARHNIPMNSVLRWDPVPENVSPTVELLSAFTGGTDPAGEEALMGLAVHEQVGPTRSLDLWRSRIGGMPGAMIVWEGSNPADGVTVPSTRRTQQMGRGSQLWKELYTLLVFVTKDTSAHARREQGFAIIDAISELLSDRHAVDGVPISNPDGVQIRERFRDVGDSAIYSNFYVYCLRLAATHAVTKRDSRTASPWLTASLTMQKPDEESGLIDVVIDNKVVIPQ